MKVAMFTDTFLPNANGVVTSILNQIKGLKRRGIDVVVFAPGEKTKLEEYYGAKVYYIKGLDFKSYPGYKIVLPDKFLSRILAFLEIEEPDIYHVHSPFSLGIAGLIYASKFKKPVVGTFHTHLGEYIGYLRNGHITKIEKNLLNSINWKYLKFFFNSCDATISPTKEIAKLLKQKKFKNVNVVPSTIDFKWMDKQKKTNILKKHNIKKSKKIILYVGRLGFEKKLNILFDAFKLLSNDYYLIIVGEGPFEDKYKKYVKDNKINNVIFTGYIPDKKLPSYYANCDIFVSPSDTETQGLTFIEAMHFGKPVVGVNKYGVKEIIKNYKNGLKCKPNDPLDLKNKIEKLNNKKLYQKLSANAKKYSLNYSVDKVINKTIRIYTHIKRSKKKTFLNRISKRFKNILNFV